MAKVRICHISDSHLFHMKPNGFKPPKADILVHSGDFTFEGSVMEIQDSMKWLGSLPYEVIVFCVGNHDALFEIDPMLARSMIPKKAIYLQNTCEKVKGINFWGSPWTRRFENWAFQIDSDDQARSMWSLIPLSTDILVTHGPPKDILDLTYFTREHVGCPDLAKAVSTRNILLHCFGHIHSEHGIRKVKGTTFSNGVLLDEAYDPTHKPNLFDVDVSARTVEVIHE